MRVSLAIYCFCLVFVTAAAAMIDNPQLAVAAGFGVSPSSLEFTVEKGSSVSRQLMIYNTGPASRFTAVSEDPAISVEPAVGLLNSGKAATVTVTATGKKPGKSGSEILISLVHASTNADREVRLSLGTKVGVSLSVVESALQSANPFVGMLISAAVVVAGLSAYLTLRRKNALLLPAKA